MILGLPVVVIIPLSLVSSGFEGLELCILTVGHALYSDQSV